MGHMSMFRISLREMLVFVAAIALAIVSLRSASPLWQGLVGLMAMLAIGMAVITGIFDSGLRRAFAIGAAILMIPYAILCAVNHFAPPNWEIFPTSLLLQEIHPVLGHGGYVYETNSEDIPAEAQVTSNPDGTLSFNGQTVIYVVRPYYKFFNAIGHWWFLLLFGYAGGRFARFVYMRRSKESPPENQSAAG
jgi:hypothetical protein